MEARRHVLRGFGKLFNGNPDPLPGRPAHRLRHAGDKAGIDRARELMQLFVSQMIEGLPEADRLDYGRAVGCFFGATPILTVAEVSRRTGFTDERTRELLGWALSTGTLKYADRAGEVWRRG